MKEPKNLETAGAAEPSKPSKPSPIHAPKGVQRSCRGWHQEAALRMLMNSLDPAVAERPEELVVHAGNSKVARNWDCFHAIVNALRGLGDDETLLVQSGKPAGVFPTHAQAPRVLIANGNLVGRWSSWEQFRELERAGLMMYGETATAGWMYVGAQGVLPSTYATFAAAARQHFAGDVSGKLIVSGGMGGMGGAQPLAATMQGAAFLGIEADAAKITRRIRAGYCDYCVNNLDEALRILKIAVRQRKPVSAGLVGNCAEVLPELARRGVCPDLLTDQTSAHDPLQGYIPAGLTLRQAAELREKNPEDYLQRSCESIGRHVTAMLELQTMGAVTFEFGNNLRAAAFERAGVRNAFDFPGFIAAYLQPLLNEGWGSLCSVALSGDAADIYCIDAALLDLGAGNAALKRWIHLAQNGLKFQGLPARACWLSSNERAALGERINEMVEKGELKAPVVMGGELPGGAAAASPYGETENMKDGSDAVADWPLLNALLHTASGASWVSIEASGGGTAVRAAHAIVADGTPEMTQRIRRVFVNDSRLATTRAADAGGKEP